LVEIDPIWLVILGAFARVIGYFTRVKLA